MNKYLEKMNNEMTLRQLSPKTKYCYLNTMERLIKHYKKSPEKISQEEVKQFFIQLKKWNGKDLSPNSVNRMLGGVKFFYRTVLHWKDMNDWLPKLKTPKTIPIVFSQQEIKQMIDSLTNIRFKAIFMTIYSTGMRLGEIQRLAPTDIDSSRMVINIRQGKGNKDRQTVLSPKLLDVLRQYWKENTDIKDKYLFVPSKNTYDGRVLINHPLSHTGYGYVLKTAAKAAGIKKKSIHML